MTKTSVIIAAGQPTDVQARGIEAAVNENGDMTLVGGRIVALHEIAATLEKVPSNQACALVLVGPHADVKPQEVRWLADHPRLVVLRVEVFGVMVHIALRDPNMKIVLDYLRELVERAGRDPFDRISQVNLRPAPAEPEASRIQVIALAERPVLTAAINWIKAVFARAGLSLPLDDVVGVEELPEKRSASFTSVSDADARLEDAVKSADTRTEPLAALARRLDLSPLEYRFSLLALAPELDTLYQRCISDLLGDSGRHVGTLGLYAALLGKSVEVRQELALTGKLARWRLLDHRTGQPLPAGDEPVRLDPCVVDWLLGNTGALEEDPRLRRVLRRTPWPGASLIEQLPDIDRAARQLQMLQQPVRHKPNGPHWLLYNGDQIETWHALLERAANLLDYPPLRVQATRFAGLDVVENCETARRLTRLARLAHRPLLLDAARVEATADNDEALRLLLGEISAARCRAGIICANVSRFVGLLGAGAIEIVPDNTAPQLARQRSLKAAAHSMGLVLADDLLQSLEQQVPLQADGWERALHLARARRQPNETNAQLTQRFVAACRDVAAETISNLATRLDPHCELKQVVLPEERKQQLRQIVDGVNFARHVLDEWQFGEQLAYGRGVTALFHGPSGTGKTMSALAVAKELKSQVLRIDLSRVVSKYIGETEKHIDAVFRDAAQCGAVLLIDEAEALLGKRGEIKDAHDRYAAIEVAYLLTRIESYDGVALFTTNARQNLDAAFLRRMRFIIEFPRPDVAAREEIWRNCLPPKSHEISDAVFRLLARKIDMTGGHIRQITLQAAFLAAARKVKINLEHIAHASAAELAKVGLPPVALELPASSKAA